MLLGLYPFDCQELIKCFPVSNQDFGGEKTGDGLNSFAVYEHCRNISHSTGKPLMHILFFN